MPVLAFDSVEFLGLYLIAGSIGFAGDPLDLQCRDVACDCGICPRCCPPAYRTGHATVVLQALELLAGIIGGPGAYGAAAYRTCRASRWP
jgi:hypothetical protein